MESVYVTVGGKFQAGYLITKHPDDCSIEKTFKQSLKVDKGDIINFQTRESSRTNASGVVALLIELEI